ncbi:hypothetical protein, partial [Maricaulis salignorans]|uniref:hypothetical protein n=1 Tax=Maricaulis salignorans TaxID=144026 RepID=UPI001F2471B9
VLTAKRRFAPLTSQLQSGALLGKGFRDGSARRAGAGSEKSMIARSWRDENVVCPWFFSDFINGCLSPSIPFICVYWFPPSSSPPFSFF